MESHDTDPLSFTAGLIFALIAVVALVGNLTLDDIRGDWVGPVLLGGAGIALLASVPLGRRTERPSEPGPPASTGTADSEGTSEPAEREISG